MKSSRQIKDRIKNISIASRIDAQTLLKRHFMECFLERVSRSTYRDKLILKGGVLISALVGLHARSTIDIDMTAKRLPLDADSIGMVVNDLAQIDLQDGIAFALRNIEYIHEGSDYPCFRVTVDVRFDTIQDCIKMDVTSGDVITPKEIKFGYETMLEKRKLDLFSYNIETILAEKIETILFRSTLNTRMRDYYDCHVLACLYRDSIDFFVLGNALKATASKRETKVVLDKTQEIVAELRTSDALEVLWKSYTKRYSYANGIAFEDTINTLCMLLNKIRLLD